MEMTESDFIEEIDRMIENKTAKMREIKKMNYRADVRDFISGINALEELKKKVVEW